MPFGRIGRQNNRSQHALPVLDPPSSSPTAGVGGGTGNSPTPPGAVAAGGGAAAAAAAPAPAASAAAPSSASAGSGSGAGPSLTPTNPPPLSASSTAFSSNESFDTRPASQQQLQQLQPPLPPPQHHLQQQQQQQQQHQQRGGYPVLPPTHLYNPTSPNNPQQQLHSPGTGPSPVFESTQKPPQDFADLVSRSQSQRYPPPVQTHLQYSLASSSADDLQQQVFNPTSPISGGQPHFQTPLPQPVPDQKRSTRKLIKNIFTSASRDHHHHHHHQSHVPQSSYDNTSGLARRPSKRVSHIPNIRSGNSQVSQASSDQQAPDWQSHGLHTQPSPLQGVGEFDEQYLRQDPNIDVAAQNPQEPPHTTIRQVPADLEQSPYGDYGDEDADFPRQQPHLQTRQDQHQHQHPYGRPEFDHPRQQQFLYQNPPPPGPYQATLPQLYTSHLTPNPNPNPETSSQVSRESPVAESDQVATALQSAQVSPSVNYNHSSSENPLPPLPPGAHQGDSDQPPLGPSGGPQPRRSQEREVMGRQDPPSAPPPSYRHSQAPLNTLNPMAPPPPGPGAASSAPYRGTGGADRQIPYEGSGPDQGRNSPQPSSLERDDPDKAFKDLLTKYKNVKRLYFDGKSQIEGLSHQVEHLQNAIANQRMSQSRTALDDNEYITRFNRLNGAINNLSFNIRKDWKTVPQWLDRYVSLDALKTGKQEMTAVGRAVITRWIVEEVFNKCFHPALESGLSRDLKEIEMNIRRLAYAMNSQEEFDALTAKVVGWRMATLDGLAPMLSTPESAENRSDFTKKTTTNLTAQLFQYLVDPPPPGVDGSASMIVELAVGLAMNLPLESRDVCIIYPLPGDPVQTHIMEVEKQGLPVLEPQKSSEGERDVEGEDSADGKEKSSKKDHAGGKSRSVPTPKDVAKIRLAGFVAVEVRGRQVLVKAPVWPMG